MDSLIARALDTAAARGASYADARMVETAQERYSVRTGVVDVISNDESVGIGVRVVVDGAWGFASTNSMTAESVDQTAALAVEIARASATSGGPRVELGPPVTSRGVYTTPVEIRPVHHRARGKGRSAAGRRRTHGSSGGDIGTHGKPDLHPGAQVLRQQRGRRRRADHLRGRRRHPGHRSGQRRGAAPFLPEFHGPAAGVQRLGVRARLRPCWQRRAGGQRGRGTAHRGPLPLGHHHHADHRRVAGWVADPRVLRPRHRAGPSAGFRGSLRRHVVPDHRQAARLPLRIRAGEHHRRQHPAAGPRILRLGRRGRAGAVDTHRRGGPVRRLPDVSGDSRNPGAGVQRHHAGLVVEPAAADPHDQRQPGAGRVGAGRPDCRHRRRHLHGHEPLLVH